ncbi:glycosyltransferase family 4 protein [Dyadobacter sp. 3J3]|uniref:glycosyltransferase family 4 protein n=1 Tax=Dyadobacter sp. 3J3 TaxID=2606600 RepID=UPI00135A124A|nr:glycosyltransferase family 4 protein [Dyadobacter sp. 3J3]
MAKILSVISVCGKTGGTTIKLKKLVEESIHDHYVYFALYDKDIIKDYPENKKWFASDKVKVFEGFYGRNFIQYSMDIIKIAKENQIDVIHFYFNFENTFAPLVKLFYPKATLIRSIVGYDEPLSKARSFVLNQVLKPVDHVIFISNYIKKLYINDYKSLEKKPSTIIYNAGIQVTDNISNPVDRTDLVSVSGLCQRKNLGVLVKAMEQVVDKFPDQKLYIVGDGPSRKEIETLIEELDLKNNVILVGYSTKITEYLNKCKIYVHPADTEGFGIAVTEAMYMKSPAIVSNAGALPELVSQDKTGLIVDPYDPNEWAQQIIFLLEHEDIRLAMANESHERATSVFPLEAFINNHDDLYSKSNQ